MSIANVNVSVAADHLDRFPEVVQRIQKAGLRVEQQLEQIGVVTGSIDSANLTDLRQVEGVTAVERSREFQLAPPDSETQ